MGRTFLINRLDDINNKFVRRVTMRRRINAMNLNNVSLRQQNSLQRTSNNLNSALTNHVNRALNVITNEHNSSTIDSLLFNRQDGLIVNATSLRKSNSLRIFQLRRGLVTNRLTRRQEEGSLHITNDTFRSFNNRLRFNYVVALRHLRGVLLFRDFPLWTPRYQRAPTVSLRENAFNLLRATVYFRENARGRGPQMWTLVFGTCA